MYFTANNQLVMENSFGQELLSTAKLFKLSQQTTSSSDSTENVPVSDPSVLDVNEKPRLGGCTGLFTQHFSEPMACQAIFVPFLGSIKVQCIAISICPVPSPLPLSV